MAPKGHNLRMKKSLKKADKSDLKINSGEKIFGGFCADLVTEPVHTPVTFKTWPFLVSYSTFGLSSTVINGWFKLKQQTKYFRCCR